MLHFPVMVNGSPIGRLEAVRVEGGTEPDDVNTYEIRVEMPDEHGPRWILYRIEHRYGDGAWALIREALNVLLAPKVRAAQCYHCGTGIEKVENRSWMHTNGLTSCGLSGDNDWGKCAWPGYEQEENA